MAASGSSNTQQGVVVRFRELKKPKKDVFSLELSKQNTYDEVVESVARHLNLDDPSRIRLTSHNCYMQGPKSQPIKYRGKKFLKEMLIHYSKTCNILYYETVDPPLPELELLKTLKVFFRRATRNEEIVYAITMPKQYTVGELLDHLKTVVPLSDPNVRLRLLEVMYNKIFKIFFHFEKVENISDKYAIILAEEIPEEEKGVESDRSSDILVQVCHFKKAPQQDRVKIKNFKLPFLLVIHQGETLADIKIRLKERLYARDEQFSQLKFGFVSWGRCEYFKESDIVSTPFVRHDKVVDWEEYLGLELPENAFMNSSSASQAELSRTLSFRYWVKGDRERGGRRKGKEEAKPDDFEFVTDKHSFQDRRSSHLKIK